MNENENENGTSPENLLNAEKARCEFKKKKERKQSTLDIALLVFY